MSDVPPGPSVLSPAPTDISPLSATLNHSGAYGKVPGPQPGGGGEQEEEEAAALDGADQERSGEGGPRSANSVGNYPEPNRAKKGVLHLHHHHHHHHHHQQQQQRLLNGCVISPELHYKAECKGRLSCVDAATAVEFHPGLSLPEGGRRKADGNYCESPNVNHANQRTAEAAGANTLNPSDGLDRIAISPDDDEQYRLAASIADCSLHPEQQPDSIRYVGYESELQMPDIMRLITKDLSEPYSIYTYRYFIHNWPQLCFLAMVGDECVGAIVCKLDMHKKMFRRGYIAMLAVDSKYRRKSIGTNLVKKAIYAMVEGDCDEVVLETEITNKSALKLYENLGFVRDKRLFRYYLNGVDALRLKLWLR